MIDDFDLDSALRHVDRLTPADKQRVLELIDRRDRVKRVEEAREHFLPFVKACWPDFISGAHHTIMAEAFEEIANGTLTRLIINMPPRHDLRLDQVVPTTHGFKKIGDIAKGDIVFGPDGDPRLVTGKSPVNRKPTYKVTTSDGAELVVSEDHLWTVRFECESDGPLKTLSTKALYERQLAHPNTSKPPKLPRVTPVRYPRADLPINPYVLGVWLGDGSSRDASIGCGFADLPAMRAQIEAQGYETTHNPEYQKFNILGLNEQLRVGGLFKNKHVPEAYLCASVEQRLALLQGLIDTDGDVTREGKVTFNNSNDRLVEGVLCLVRSLGVKAKKTHRQTSYKGKPSQPSMRVTFKLANAARLPRKAERCRALGGNWARTIKIEPTGLVEETQCLQVANEDGLFLAGRGYIVTHNTKSELASYLLPAWFLGRNPKKKIIQASNTEALAAGFGRKVRNLISGSVPDDDDDDGVLPAIPYNEIFPKVSLAKDSQAAAGWHTNRGGEYFAIGVNGKVTGKGGDIVIIDDPHALEITTEIPTPEGFKTIEELQVGDFVYGPDGKPTRVTAKSAVWHQHELFRVTTNDDQSVLCDGAHLWNYRSDTKIKAPFYTATTFELSKWAKANKPVTPRHAPVEYPEAKLPIDPYILGAWLGDGTSSLGRMTAHPDDQPFMRAQFVNAGYELTDLTDPFNFGVLTLRRQLIDLGVLNHKHIPERYMTGAVAQRLALLQGLMDTDGNVTAEGQCSFNNANERLARQVQELVHSLGARATLKHIDDTRKRWRSAQVMHRVNFKLQDAARMPRKRGRTFTPTDKRGRSIKVEATGQFGSVQCISVERPDGLFLVGRGYVVTHNSEQEARQAETSPEIFDAVYEWYTSGPRQRLQPGGAIIIVQTRWSKRDLSGQVLRKQASREPGDTGDQWKVIEFPAILDEGEPTERSLWPAYWPLKTLQATKAELPVAKWKAQYQQKPTSEEGAIIKREAWRRWGYDPDPSRSMCPSPAHQDNWRDLKSPACSFIMLSIDTALKKTERADYSAFTTWGVFEVEDRVTGKVINNLILLSAWKARLEFPELKKTVRQFHREDEPDTILIEDKGSGTSLIQELRAMDIPVENFSYGRGKAKGSGMSNDKVSRANMITDIFASGYVWAPERRFADECIEECAEFPYGDHDDYVDTVVQALLRFRSGGFIRTANDVDDDEDEAPRRRRKPY